VVIETKKYFVSEINKAEAQLDLARAALLFSQHLTQAPDLDSYLAGLDNMAEVARPLIEAAQTAAAKIEALNHYFFDELNFQGNARDYYNPNNSFLDRVMDLKLGIPISLSVLYLEIGRRLALPLWGVGMPGHFIVGGGSPNQPLYIDVFNQGQLLTEEDCLTLCNITEPQQTSFKKQFLRPATKKEILFRMLLNLKHIYVNGEDWPAAHTTVDLLLAIQPDQANEFKDRGLLAYRLDRLQEAIFDLKRYLFLTPLSPDKEWLEERLMLMEEKLSQLN
jgi:regulator of sirC expression with transglutaminase-like and TPR domain